MVRVATLTIEATAMTPWIHGSWFGGDATDRGNSYDAAGYWVHGSDCDAADRGNSDDSGGG